MPPDFSIRPARPEDAGQIARVHQRAIRLLARESYSAAELESWADGVKVAYYRLRIEDTPHFELAEDGGGAVIGFAAVRDDEMWLLYIDPDWARRGIGSALLRRAEANLLDAGHEDIWVQSSLNARTFYAKHGYLEQETFDAPTRGGLALKAVRMTKRLGRDPRPA